MQEKIIIPEIGYSSSEMTLSSWIVESGSKVEKGESIAEIESEKSVTELAAPISGYIGKQLFVEGDTVSTGDLICTIFDTLEAAEKDEIENTTTSDIVPKTSEKLIERSAIVDRKDVIATPAAKKIASENGIDIHSIIGTGPCGRITKEDVYLKIDEGSVVDITVNESEDVKVMPLTVTRKTIAKRLAQSRRDIPDVTTFMQVDVSELTHFRKNQHPDVSFTAFIAYAAMKAIAEYPLVNSTFVEEEIHNYRHVNLGVAIELERGLVVPVISAAEKLDLGSLSKEIALLNQKANSDKLSPNELHGGSFTITNSGVFGAAFFTPIINAPEVAILGIGKMQNVPKFQDRSIVEGKIMTLCLSYDHRVLDGSYSVQFLSKVKENLEAFGEIV